MRYVAFQARPICQKSYNKLEARVHRIPRALTHTFVQKKKNPEFDLAVFDKISPRTRRRSIVRSHFC